MRSTLPPTRNGTEKTTHLHILDPVEDVEENLPLKTEQCYCEEALTVLTLNTAGWKMPVAKAAEFT